MSKARDFQEVRTFRNGEWGIMRILFHVSAHIESPDGYVYYISRDDLPLKYYTANVDVIQNVVGHPDHPGYVDGVGELARFKDLRLCHVVGFHEGENRKGVDYLYVRAATETADATRFIRVDVRSREAVTLNLRNVPPGVEWANWTTSLDGKQLFAMSVKQWEGVRDLFVAPLEDVNEMKLKSTF